MKSMIISVILMAAVLCGSTWYTSKLKDVSESLGELNNEVQSDLNSGDMTGATEKIDKMNDFLNEHEQVLEIMGDHDEIDKIRMSMAELYRYTKGGMQTDAMSKSEVLGFLYEHLPDNYKLKVENVL